MTTITFERSGGAAGKDLHLDLDLNTLPEDESQHLLKLIDEADFFNIPEHPAEQFKADEFQYTIGVNAGHATTPFMPVIQPCQRACFRWPRN